MHSVLPVAYVAESKGMVGLVVGLVASLLSLVLSLLIWTSHGLCTAQQSQLQTIGSSIIRLNFVLKAYGPEAEPGRVLLRDHVERIRARLWYNLDERPLIYHAIYHADVPEDVDRMIAFFVSLRPANEEQRQYLASARDIFGAILETQLTIFRSLFDRVPFLLLGVVLGWSCVLFFGYGLLSDVDVLTIVLAGLGATCVASAVFLILELSDPYSGLFRMPREGFDGIVRSPDKGRRDGGQRRDLGSKFGTRVRQRFIARSASWRARVLHRHPDRQKYDHPAFRPEFVFPD